MKKYIFIIVLTFVCTAIYAQLEELNQKLFNAYLDGNCNLAKELIDSGANINMHVSVNNVNAWKEKELAETQFIFNPINQLETTLLNYLISNCYSVDITAAIDEFGNITEYAICEVYYDRLESVKHIILNGADVNSLYPDGYSALLVVLSNIAVPDLPNDNFIGRSGEPINEENPYPTIALLLINNNADINIKDAKGNSPLHLACDYPYGLQILKLLIEKGADVNLKNNNGKTPADLAKEAGNEDIFEYLNEIQK